MPARHVVVDGSNIATEGNSLPSLKQLDEAVREYLRENPDDTVTVVVDATFGHRIPPEEREMFEQAEREGDIVSPPAGAIGRGDAFLLRIADKVGAVVLSNDSFQEFHGEHEWLFDKGRLVGGKPVPGVGWIFTPRTPVRGPKSRESLKEAKRKHRDEPGGESSTNGGGESSTNELELPASRPQRRSGTRRLQRAIEVATEEAVLPEEAAKKRRRRRRAGEAPSDPVNNPLAFISFIASYRLGDQVEGVVEEFSSHGAYISAGGARCYLPLSAMGNPAPRSARDVLSKGEDRSFIVQAFDPMRRGIELALPGFAHPAGAPTPETVEAEIHQAEELGAAGPASADGAASSTSPAPKRPRPRRARASADTAPAEPSRPMGRGLDEPPAGAGEQEVPPGPPKKSSRSTRATRTLAEPLRGSPTAEGTSQAEGSTKAESTSQAEPAARRRRATLSGIAGNKVSLAKGPQPAEATASKSRPRATKPNLTVLAGVLEPPASSVTSTAKRRRSSRSVADGSGLGAEAASAPTERQLDG